ncbi:MAG: GNAT family N-acetyltransferase [Oscillospiraceae bacterium]|nr:GNAT family N-acetyltransferase [Oscillospiraceae bacterium]
MNLTIRRAEIRQIDEIVELFGAVCDALAAAPAVSTGWRRGMYPTREHVVADVADGTLFAAESDCKIVGVATFDGNIPESYSDFAWRVDAADGDVLTVHRLAVHPEFRGLSVARALLDHAETHARTLGKRAIRFDTYHKNVAAAMLYTSCGYTHVDTGDIRVDPTFGLFEFKLFEKSLD